MIAKLLVKSMRTFSLVTACDLDLNTIMGNSEFFSICHEASSYSFVPLFLVYYKGCNTAEIAFLMEQWYNMQTCHANDA